MYTNTNMKNILAALFVIISFVFSMYIFFLTFYKNHEVNNTEVVNTIVCSTGQNLENGVCVSITKTCPDGEVVAIDDDCVTDDIATTTSISGRSIVNNKATSSNESSIIDKTLPHINKIIVTGGGGSMTVAIYGVNFSKTSNEVTLFTSVGITKKLILPAYPNPSIKNTQLINFQMTDFRTVYKGAYSFQVSVKGKESNIFNVEE